MDDYWICTCGSELSEGDHRRCWVLDAFDEDEVRTMLR